MATYTRKDLFNSLPSGERKAGYDAWLSNGGASDGYFDDDYLAEIEKYKNTPYYQQLLTNPWLAGNQAKFSPTFFQKVGSWFGDNSARDRYYSDLQSNRSQWLSEYLDRMRQQEYDSPTAQVERERAAGLNPDLNGNITPGSASENDQPLQSVEMPTNSFVQEIGSMGMQFISQVIGMAQSFQSLKAGNLSLVQQEISANSSARDFVLNQIAGSSFFNSELDLDHIDPADLANNIISASSRVDYSTYSPRTRKLIKSMFGRYAKDVRTGRSPMAVEALKSELRNRIVSNNGSAVKGASSPLFDEDFNKWLRKVAEIFGKAEMAAELAELKSRTNKADYESSYFHYLDPELQASTEKAELQSRTSKANFDSSYFHTLDPETKATAENSESKARSVLFSQQKISEQLWTDLYTVCDDSNSWYGTLGLIAFPLLRSILSNVSLSAGRFGKNGSNFGVTSLGF